MCILREHKILISIKHFGKKFGIIIKNSMKDVGLKQKLSLIIFCCKDNDIFYMRMWHKFTKTQYVVFKIMLSVSFLNIIIYIFTSTCRRLKKIYIFTGASGIFPKKITTYLLYF